MTALELFDVEEIEDGLKGYEVVKQQRIKDGLWEAHIKNSNCEDIWDKLKPIEFKIDLTQVQIEP